LRIDNERLLRAREDTTNHYASFAFARDYVAIGYPDGLHQQSISRIATSQHSLDSSFDDNAGIQLGRAFANDLDFGGHLAFVGGQLLVKIIPVEVRAPARDSGVG
jgi:hypothetical protein